MSYKIPVGTLYLELDGDFDMWCPFNWKRRRRAHSLEFIFATTIGGKTQFKLVKGKRMQFSMLVGQKVSVVGTPVDANGNPSQATLSNFQYSTSDPSVFTFAVDPNVVGGAILTAVAPGSATLMETATATEPDGKTTESIQGVATIVISSGPPPVAASIVFNFGTAS